MKSKLFESQSRHCINFVSSVELIFFLYTKSGEKFVENESRKFESTTGQANSHWIDSRIDAKTAQTGKADVEIGSKAYVKWQTAKPFSHHQTQVSAVFFFLQNYLKNFNIKCVIMS